MLAPLSNYWGGLPPPWPPLFLRLLVSLWKLQLCHFQCCFPSQWGPTIILKVNGYTFQGSNSYFDFCISSQGQFFKKRIRSPKSKFFPFKGRTYFERAVLPMKTNWNSRKLLPFANMAVEQRGVPTHIEGRICSPCEQDLSCKRRLVMEGFCPPGAGKQTPASVKWKKNMVVYAYNIQ